MNTLNIQSSKTMSNSKISTISKIMEYATFNQFGVMAMMLIFVGCLSGATVGMVGFSSDFALISTIIPTMTTLALILSVQPIKGILIAGLVTTIVDVILLTTLLF